MFSQNQEEVKLEWMYKGPHSNVDREEYLLGRAVDKTLEHINSEEKQQIGISQPKNHVEHECIPPSIREYKQQLGDQVDITAKLQEDPLIAIKKQEEEKRRQFLNNPVQIKKLQKALKAQKKKKLKSINSDKDIDAKLFDKLKLLKGGTFISNDKSTKSKNEGLDTILMHKYNQLKSKLSDDDLRDIFEGNVKSSSSSSDSSSKEEDEEDSKATKRSKTCTKTKKEYREVHSKYDKSHRKRSRSLSREKGKFKNDKFEKSVSSKKQKHSKSVNYPPNDRKASKTSKSSLHRYEHSDKKRHRYDDSDTQRHRYEEHDRNRHKTPHSHSLKKTSKAQKSSSSESASSTSSDSSSSSSDSDSKQPKKKNWGLVKADGTKIPLTVQNTKHQNTYPKPQSIIETKPSSNRYRQHLTEDEKEKRRKEMLQNASWREKERSQHLESYRKKQLKEDEERKSFDPKFLQKELLKSANSASVESRIKANINHIQRSGGDMNRHFSRR